MGARRSLRNLLDQYIEASVFESGLSENTLSAYTADLNRYLLHLEDSEIDNPKGTPHL